jgi:2-hydroxycyclohexanecarboxyl-CoA dehydrogenase
MTANRPQERARTALVTGAARGIGRAIAQALASDGRRVAVADILEHEARATADDIGGMAVRLDVTETASVSRGIDEVEQQLGPIEILVNNAGWDELRPFLETDENFWDNVIELNFKACLRLCHRVVPGMVEREWGRVVNISSDAARVGSSLEAVYSGAKGAVISFTKTLARETARNGVTANAVCPGPTETPLLDDLVSKGERGARAIESMRRAVPMRRLGKPEEVGAAVAFLASEQAGFITGQTLSVSGGLTMA